ncbi:hypothetical protein ACH5RR_003520 [Cinchona calisaya]|uniref:Uncharacterized protein n=1 Tax=Cinchona calisaya TaxID=153742 RepID=A0ABD3AV44_9GENT
MHHTNISLGEGKRLASQYQKETEKCNAVTETCEEAREQVQAMLSKEKKNFNVGTKSSSTKLERGIKDMYLHDYQMIHSLSLSKVAKEFCSLSLSLPVSVSN